MRRKIVKRKFTSTDNPALPNFGLFNYNKLKHPILFFKDYRIYRRRIRKFKTCGYSTPAEYLTSRWMISVFRSLLIRYKYYRRTTPYVLQEPMVDSKEQQERNKITYEEDLDKMLELLDEMEKEDETFANESLKAVRAKNKFFRLFSKYFYNLWD